MVPLYRTPPAKSNLPLSRRLSFAGGRFYRKKTRVELHILQFYPQENPLFLLSFACFVRKTPFSVFIVLHAQIFLQEPRRNACSGCQQDNQDRMALADCHFQHHPENHRRAEKLKAP